MEKEEALEWARKCARYWDARDMAESVVVANEIVAGMTVRLATTAEAEEWYDELAEACGWEED